MITIDGSQIDRARAALAGIDNGFARAVATSLNRASTGFVTDAVKGTSGKYYIKSSEVRKALSIRKASAASMQGAVLARGKRKSLADYKLTPSSPKPGRRSELRGAVKKDGLKPLGRAFLVNRGGKWRPYVRSGGRLSPFISPSVPQIVKNEETLAAAEQGVTMRFNKQINHEILRLLGVFRQ